LSALLNEAKTPELLNSKKITEKIIIMGKNRQMQRQERRAKREEEQAQKVMKWVFIGLGVLALVGICWAALM